MVVERPRECADQVQVIAELNEQSYLAAWTRQKPIHRQVEDPRSRKKRSRCTRSRPKASTGTISALGLEFSERDMNGPLFWSRGAQAVIREIDAFTDTHAGRAEQQEDISAEIVAAHELLLQELILLGGEGGRGGSMGRARNAPRAAASGPVQRDGWCRANTLMEDGAQSEEPADTGCRGLGAESAHANGTSSRGYEDRGAVVRAE